MSFRASAPGSLMLLGEHAVLHGKHALVCAVDKRITVTVTPRADDVIFIRSDRLGQYSTRVAHIQIEKPFQFVLGAIKQYESIMQTGCDILIESAFSDKVGLGSSAAVTVAVLAALAKWSRIKIATQDLVRQGRKVIRHIQGVGSGADVAASVYGGIIGYHPQPLSVEKFTSTYPLTVLYSGKKTPTPEVIKYVQDKFAAYPTIFRSMINSIGQCAFEGMQLVRKEKWADLGQVMTMQQGLMESLGVSDLLLRYMLEELRSKHEILGSKISGSGLGDCVVGLGQLPVQETYIGERNGIQRIFVDMTLQGVHCEKI